MIRVSLAILAVTLTLATSARAQDNENVPDVRCLVVALDLAKSPDPQMRSLAMSAGLYFVGRLRGRAPDLDLEAAIVQQLRIMTHEDLRAERDRCGTVLAGQADRLAVLGEHLRSLAETSAVTAPPAEPAPPK